MNIDDVIYVVCLLACIGAGNYVRKVPDKTQKKYISTALGILMVFIVSGWNSFHCFVSALLGAAAVIYVHPRYVLKQSAKLDLDIFVILKSNHLRCSKCHLAAFTVMFGYLAFFRLASMFGLPDPPGHINMIQMIMTLKVRDLCTILKSLIYSSTKFQIAGIGFEKTASWKKLKEREKNEDVEISEYDSVIQSVNIVEILHYSFNYIGILTGECIHTCILLNGVAIKDKK